MRQTGQSVRKTRKQRGGATWNLPHELHLEKWLTVISMLPDPLKSNLLPLVTAGALRDAALKKKRLDSYLTAIEHQDELFNMAINLIKDELTPKNINVSTKEEIIANAMAIDAEKALAKLYIEDVEVMISLKIDKTNINTEYEDKHTHGPSKLQLIKNENEHLSAMLLFPERLNNIFIQSLANLFILLKKNPENRQKITTNDSTVRLATDQYISNIYANARLLTSFDLRDGFYLNQGVTEFQKIMEGGESSSFYSELLTKINREPTDKYLARASEWYDRALAVFFWYLKTEFRESDAYDRSSILNYMRNSSKDILEKDKITMTNVSRAYPKLNEYFPEKEYYEIPLDDKGTTLLSMLNIMGPEELEFVLHLAYTLWKSDKEQKESV